VRRCEAGVDTLMGFTNIFTMPRVGRCEAGVEWGGKFYCNIYIFYIFLLALKMQ
jgi:hypothetical protein